MLYLTSTYSHVWHGPILLKGLLTTETYLQKTPTIASNYDISCKSYMSCNLFFKKKMVKKTFCGASPHTPILAFIYLHISSLMFSPQILDIGNEIG